jgi:hypothetical protein
LREREHIQVDTSTQVLERDAQGPQSVIPDYHRRRGGEQQSVAFVERLGLNRDTQSMLFFSTPGIDTLFSGDEITKPSQASRRRQNSLALSGNPPPSGGPG